MVEKMKQINKYIIEKFKISSKTLNKFDTKDIQIKLKREIVDFPDSDLDQIIEFAESLQIRPDKIEYFQNSNAIRLGYLYKDNQKLQYGIIFGYITTSKGYRIEYIEDYNNIYEEYPKFPKVITLEDCFDYIDKKFDDWIK